MSIEMTSSAEAREAIIRRLREHGITPTQQRVEIAGVLFDRHQHVSADQVLARVNARDAAVSKATVYNTLGLFAEKGLIRQVIVDPARVFYDSNLEPHHHLFHMDTGALEDIPLSKMDVTGLPDLPSGMDVAGVDVVIRVRRSD
ncbi:transcriptional repressor [Thioalkalivibrio denitrificans]|uniref:Ferric uptake regulation protein n=2 Tax=Thioalkalivibrio denitrificans TaxID=108003 RepID=A0A1V3NG60_9GAMM|nr:transcriptional repressor [Thioalkalivibrio denitrificans]